MYQIYNLIFAIYSLQLGIDLNKIIAVTFMIGSGLAAVLGGIGSIPGAMLGIIENFGASYISSVYKDAFAFLVLIITLVLRPLGLLGQKTVDKV